MGEIIRLLPQPLHFIFFAGHDDVLGGGKIVRQFCNEVINYIVSGIEPPHLLVLAAATAQLPDTLFVQP